MARPADFGNRAQPDPPPHLRVNSGVRVPEKNSRRRAAPPTIAARLNGRVTLEARADGEIAACFDGYAVDLGKFSAGVAHRAQDLRIGLPLAPFAAGGRNSDKGIGLVMRRGPGRRRTASCGL